MDCCNTGKMLPLEDAKKRLQEAITPIQTCERITIDKALDRILSEDIKSPIAVPGYDNSAMDGYALRAEDLISNDTLTLIGKSFAGSPYSGQVKAGECVRIMTGAAVPNGANTVIMQERSNIEGEATIGDEVIFSHKPKADENIRRAGEDIQQDTIILPKGRRLSPIDIGLLASVGMAQVEVYTQLKIGLFSSGDELTLPGEPLDKGCIYDSNRFVVKAMLERLNCLVLDLGIIPDDPEALERAFLTAADSCHAVVSSGGVSVGEADYTKTILDKLGQVDFWKVAMKPGKPFAFGTLTATDEKKSCYFFGLPGNPVSATVTFHQLALPVIRQLAGEITEDAITLPIETSEHLKKSPGRVDFQRGRLSLSDNGKLELQSTGKQGSGILTSLSNANCYLILDASHSDYDAGDTVKTLPFDRWIS